MLDSIYFPFMGALWVLQAMINILQFLTLLPLPHVSYQPLRRVIILIPISGFLLGAMVAGLYHLGYLLNLPPFLSAFFALAGQVILTGGLHEDGLADSADALGVRQGNGGEKLQKIRMDPAIGSYGVLALLISFSGKLMAITALTHPSIIWVIVPLAHSLSRGQWAVLLYMLPLLKGSKLGKQIHQISFLQMVIGFIISLMIGYITLQYLPKSIIPAEVFLLFWLFQIYALYGFIKSFFGGISGDLLGASQQITETLLIFVGAVIIFLPKGIVF